MILLVGVGQVVSTLDENVTFFFLVNVIFLDADILVLCKSWCCLLVLQQNTGCKKKLFLFSGTLQTNVHYFFFCVDTFFKQQTVFLQTNDERK